MPRTRRLSKKLVTLDDQVKLAVPIGELAVHEPDYKRLIAFLKAMEFNGLMRRVAEFASVDAGAIDAEGRLAGHHGTQASTSVSPASAAGEDSTARAVASAPGDGFKGQAMLPLPVAPTDIVRRGSSEAPANFVSNPGALAAARREAARSEKFDRAKYETVRSLERLKAWVERARDLGMVAVDVIAAYPDPMLAELCGISLAVAPNEACYVPLSHRQGGEGGEAGLFQGDIAPRPDCPNGRRST